MQTHPDLHPNSPEKHKQFVKVNEAYEILGSPMKRKEYDDSLKFGNSYHSSYPNEGFSGDPYAQHRQRYYQQQNAHYHQRTAGRSPFDDDDRGYEGTYHDPRTG